MSKIRIGVIMNSFNRIELIKTGIRAIESWLPSSDFNGQLALIIFEAGSTDGSIEWVVEQKERWSFKTILLQAIENGDKSFAAGLNAGVNTALQVFDTIEYLLFYETDNQILSPLPLLQAKQELEGNARLAACGFTVRKQDGKPAGIGIHFPTLLNFVIGKQVVQILNLEALHLQWQKGKSNTNFSYLDVVYTSPLLVKVSAWKHSEGLDAKTFPFSDCDIDWAKRLQLKGWLMGIIKTDQVIHDNLSTKSEWSRNRALHFHRGRLNYFKRYKPKSLPFIWPSLLWLRHTLELLLVTVFITDKNRKQQLIDQFTILQKSVSKSYE